MGRNRGSILGYDSLTGPGCLENIVSSKIRIYKIVVKLESLYAALADLCETESIGVYEVQAG